jgi:hypothetical protein
MQCFSTKPRVYSGFLCVYGPRFCPVSVALSPGSRSAKRGKL